MATIAFKPFNAGRWLLWGATALLFAILPLLFRGGFAITLLSQMGIFIIFCLSYNVIFGQGGMLSFGHAVYSGLGAYFAIHALNWISASESLFTSPVSVALLPIVGGIAGAVFGVIFGYLTTKTAGTPFAMITLGIGEMVHSASLMFSGFFGGEGGVSTNRVIGEPFAGVTFGPGIQVYYLIAAWCFLSMLAMFAFSRTPLGRISNAVRDNPERVEFIGYSTRHVRFLVVIVAGFFAGIAGGLTAINFELVTAENVSLLRSGGVLLADYTNAWQFYLGVFFVLMVMYAPGGVASLILMNLRVMRYRLLGRLRGAYSGVLMSALLLAFGLIMIIELGYHLSFESALSSSTTLFGLPFDATAGSTWVLAVGTTLAGALAFEFMRRDFLREWDAVQEEIQALEDRERAT